MRSAVQILSFPQSKTFWQGYDDSLEGTLKSPSYDFSFVELGGEVDSKSGTAS